MNLLPKITVIMPSRNVAVYIRQCMDSVLGQDFLNMEILAIDAMSDDGTWEILAEYAAKDERIRLIRSERKSYGYQVNLGIREARGAYIGIVETDDFIEKQMFRILYDKAQESGADFVKGAGKNYVQVDKGVFYETDIDRYENWGIEGKEIDPADHPELLYKDRFLWLGLYKTSFLRDNEVFLSETDGAAYQDIGFQMQVLSKASKAVYIDAPVYHYRLDNAGASGYSHKAFGYLEYEFDKIFGETFNWDEIQKKNIIKKLTIQYMHRYHVMATSGEYWSDSEESMEKIRNWIMEAIDVGVLQLADMEDDLARRVQVLQSGVREAYGSALIDYLRFMSAVRDWSMKLRGNLKDKKDIIIFGCGMNGKYLRCLAECLLPGYTKAFCDNNEDLKENSILELPVLFPDEAVQQYPDAVYLTVSGKLENEMRRQLQELGIKEDHIVTYSLGRNMELLNMKSVT